MEVIRNIEGEPVDIVFRYINNTHARLEGVAPEELIGQSFFEVFHKDDKKWLEVFAETAFDGIEKKFTEHIASIRKYLQISTHKLGEGLCGCIIEDVTEKHQLLRRTEKQKQLMNQFLKSLTDMTFFYDEEKRLFYDCEVHENGEVYTIDDLAFPADLIDKSMMAIADIPILEEALTEFQTKDEIDCTVRVRAFESDQFEWYQVILRAYYDEYSGMRECIGYLKNVNKVVETQLQLKDRAERDGMTGLFNASAGRELMDYICQKNASFKIPCAFFMLDIDNFKEINDAYGHSYGDKVITGVAHALKESFRNDDVIARFGGDEFAVLAREVEEKTVEKIYNRIIANIHRLLGEHISISVGIYISSRPLSIEEFYKEADKMLYQVKMKNKGNFWIKKNES